MTNLLGLIIGNWRRHALACYECQATDLCKVGRRHSKRLCDESFDLEELLRVNGWVYVLWPTEDWWKILSSQEMLDDKRYRYRQARDFERASRF